MPSTIQIQNIVNFAATHIELLPLVGVGGYTNEPALSIANDVLSELLMGSERIPIPFPWKCNRNTANLLVTTYGKQDYLFAGASVFNLVGSGSAAAIDLKSNNAITESGGTVTVNTIEPHNFQVGDVIYMVGLPDPPYNAT